jgi:signal transduction histidine kinase/ligand-binding sensor domain-containing protein
MMIKYYRMNLWKNIWIMMSMIIVNTFQLLSAQVPHFSHYKVSDGLSQSEILCIFQDSEGYIWFGTQNGLNKFDGYTFESFFNDPSDSTTISNNWIFGITEDQNGMLWIGTKGGLNKYDKLTGNFSRVILPNGISGTAGNFIYGINAYESSLYINQSPTLSVLDIPTGKIQTYQNNFETGGTLYDKGFPVMKCSDGTIWMGSVNGLSIFNPAEKEFRYPDSMEAGGSRLTNVHITSLLEEKNGNVLIGTELGLYIYDPAAEEFVHYIHESNAPGSLSHNYIQTMVQDHSGNIWIGTDGGGLNRLTGFNETGQVAFVHFRNLADNDEFIGHDIVLSLLEDRSNNLWIGTIAGVDKTDLKKSSINSYMKTDNPNSIDLLDNVIASVFEDDDHNLWIGTWGKGLSIVDMKANKARHYLAESDGERHIPENHVHVIFKDSQSRIWLGTRNGVSILDRSSDRFIPVEEFFDAPDFNYFSNNRVYCIIEASDGRFWIGTGNGICILDTKRKERTILTADGNGALTISRNQVYSLLEDSDGEIWIAASNGLDRYDPATGEISHYTSDPGSSNTLCDNYTISLCEDRNGHIWVGTSLGISEFNKSDSTFTNYTIKDGLPSNIVYDIIMDGDGNLWFTTGSGLAMKNPDAASPDAFIIVDELLGKEFNLKAVYKNDRGELFFGAIDGLISFHPDSLTGNTFVPPVRITSFEKENNGIREKMNVYENKIDLTYKDYSFTIEFSALDFTDPSKNRYSYKMEGISDKWIEIGTRRFVPFTNLPPGDYTFHLRGCNNDGVWNLSGESLRITIHPPWWRSRYAYVVYIIVILVTIIIIIKWRERNLLREKKLLEEKISERIAEIARKNLSLEEQKNELNALNAMKDKFFSILAHDLKNPFSSLYSLSGLVVQNFSNMEDSEKLTALEKIEESTEHIYSLLNNLLTWSQSQRGDIDYSPEKFNLTNLIDLNMNLHKISAEKKGVRLVSRVSVEWQAFGDREMVSTVIRNLINNAVKYSHSESQVELSVSEKDDFLEVEVRDQGVGMSKENIEKIFRIDTKYKMPGTMGEKGTGLGLILCKDFVEMNGGRIWCESREGSGTTFHFTIPAAS